MESDEDPDGEVLTMDEWTAVVCRNGPLGRRHGT